MTPSSIWFLDDGAMIYTRLPRNESPHHPSLFYSDIGAPSKFVYAHIKTNNNRPDAAYYLCVHVDESNEVHDHIHRRITTGWVEESDWGDLKEEMGEPEECPFNYMN